MKRGFMNNTERREIQEQKWKDQGKRKHGKKYKKPLGGY